MNTHGHETGIKRVWRIHNRREEWEKCPQCGNRLKWLYIDGSWVPCNHEPVMFILHPDGKQIVIYRKDFYENALMYKRGDVRFSGMRVMQGHIQHYYMCDILKQERREWVQKKYGS